MDKEYSLFEVLFKEKLLIIGVVVLFAISGVAVSLSLSNKYEAEILLTSSESSDSSSGLSGLASQFGGLANLAGLNLAGGNSNTINVAISLLQSRQFLQNFIANREILPELLAIEEWDRESNKLIYAASKYDIDKRQWVRTPPKNKQTIPTPWEGYAELVKMLTIGDMKSDGILSVKLESQSPELAVTWLSWLIEDLNTEIREKELKETKESIEYLQQQIEKTNVKELQTIFYRLIEEQTKTLLLAEVREEFAFKVIAEPVFPEDRSSPNRALICIVFVFLGAILAVFLAILKNIFHKE